MTYELFLDENGEKISKSRGNGLAVEEWLAYAPPESLSLYMFGAPRKAKRLYFDVIPRCVDDYLGQLEKFAAEELQEHFNRCTGVELPIVTKRPAATPMIVLGWAASRPSAGSGIRLACAGVQMLFFSNAFSFMAVYASVQRFFKGDYILSHPSVLWIYMTVFAIWF